MAYGMARSARGMASNLMMLVICRFGRAFLIRVYAWVGYSEHEGC